ncbi:MAG: hypothetical protein IPJ81_02435 [Chitinophagaceae bacterium]|nr:hypothetical protein [Chitinophagaceae bacterium]
MAELEENIIRINKKFQQLLKHYQLLKKENLQQAVIIRQLQTANETAVQQSATLQQQIIILKAAAGQMNDADKKEFEKTITQYLKEIDKCINLLSE